MSTLSLIKNEQIASDERINGKEKNKEQAMNNFWNKSSFSWEYYLSFLCFLTARHLISQMFVMNISEIVDNLWIQSYKLKDATAIRLLLE